MATNNQRSYQDIWKDVNETIKENKDEISKNKRDKKFQSGKQVLGNADNFLSPESSKKLYDFLMELIEAYDRLSSKDRDNFKGQLLGITQKVSGNIRLDDMKALSDEMDIVKININKVGLAHPQTQTQTQAQAQTQAQGQTQAQTQAQGQTQAQRQGQAQAQAQTQTQTQTQAQTQAQAQGQTQTQAQTQAQAQGQAQTQTQAQGQTQGQAQGQATPAPQNSFSDEFNKYRKEYNDVIQTLDDDKKNNNYQSNGNLTDATANKIADLIKNTPFNKIEDPDEFSLISRDYGELGKRLPATETDLINMVKEMQKIAIGKIELSSYNLTEKEFDEALQNDPTANSSEVLDKFDNLVASIDGLTNPQTFSHAIGKLEDLSDKLDPFIYPDADPLRTGVSKNLSEYGKKLPVNQEIIDEVLGDTDDKKNKNLENYKKTIEYPISEQNIENSMALATAQQRAEALANPDDLLLARDYYYKKYNNDPKDGPQKLAEMQAVIAAALNNLKDITPDNAFVYMNLASQLEDQGKANIALHKISNALEAYDKEHFCDANGKSITANDLNKNYKNAQEALKDFVPTINNQATLDQYNLTDDKGKKLKKKKGKIYRATIGFFTDSNSKPNLNNTQESILAVAREAAAQELAKIELPKDEASKKALLNKEVNKQIGMIMALPQTDKDGKAYYTTSNVAARLAARHTLLEQYETRARHKFDSTFGNTIHRFLSKIDAKLTETFGVKYTNAKKYIKKTAKIGKEVGKGVVKFAIAGMVPGGIGVAALLAHNAYKQWKTVGPQIMNPEISKKRKMTMLLGTVATTAISAGTAIAGMDGVLSALNVDVPTALQACCNISNSLGILGRSAVGTATSLAPTGLGKLELRRKEKEIAHKIEQAKNKKPEEIAAEQALKNREIAQLNAQLNKVVGQKKYEKLARKLAAVQARPITLNELLVAQKKINNQKIAFNDQMLTTGLSTGLGLVVGQAVSAATTEMTERLLGQNEATAPSETLIAHAGKTDTVALANESSSNTGNDGNNQTTANQIFGTGKGNTDVANAESQTSETGNTDVANAESQTSETGKTDAANAESQTSETAKTDAANAESQTSETAKTEAAKATEAKTSETAKTEAAKATEAKTSETAKTETAKAAEAKTSEAGKTEAADANTKSGDVKAAETQTPEQIAKQNLDEAKSTEVIKGRSVLDHTKLHIQALQDERYNPDDMAGKMAQHFGEDAHKVTIMCKMAPYALQEQLHLDLPEGQTPSTYNMLQYLSEHGVPEDKQGVMDNFMDKNFDNNRFLAKNFTDYQTHEVSQNSAQTPETTKGNFNKIEQVGAVQEHAKALQQILDKTGKVVYNGETTVDGAAKIAAANKSGNEPLTQEPVNQGYQPAGTQYNNAYLASLTASQLAGMGYGNPLFNAATSLYAGMANQAGYEYMLPAGGVLQDNINSDDFSRVFQTYKTETHYNQFGQEVRSIVPGKVLVYHNDPQISEPVVYNSYESAKTSAINRLDSFSEPKYPRGSTMLYGHGNIDSSPRAQRIVNGVAAGLNILNQGIAMVNAAKNHGNF